MSTESENESEDATEYEFEPFETIFLARREEILRLVNVSTFALNSMEGIARLSEVLNREAKEVEQVQELEEMAKEEVESDFPLLHNAAMVLLWGALEAAIRDFLIRWLTKYPIARQVPDLKKIRVHVVDYESLEGEDRMRYLLGVLEREFAASLKPGVGRFDCLLKPFDISANIKDATRRDLNELAAIRNVIVHRAGIADKRLLELCPWLGLQEGQPVHVSSDSFFRLLNSTGEYVAAIIVSARKISSTPSYDQT